jgi:hypothetical protein
MTKAGLMKVLDKRIKAIGSQYRAAESMEVSPQYVNDVLMGKREPGGKLLKALGYERVVTYTKIGGR